MKKKLITVAGIATLGLLLVGCGNQSTTKSSSSNAVKTTKVAHHQQDQIVGSFKDDKDGAAITLNSDGTGQYVYADSDEPDTNDQLTWKKDGDNYTITLKDSNVSGPLTAKLTGKQLTLSGDSNWNTETFTKVKGKIDLNKLLSDAHNEGQSSNGSTSEQTGNSGQQAGNSGSEAGNTKDYSDASNGTSHHVVMSGNDDGEGHQMGVDYETDADGHQHVFQYVQQ